MAITAGVLTNVATSGLTWPVGIGLVVLAGGWVGFEVLRARNEREADASDRHMADWADIAGRQRSMAPPAGSLPSRVRGRDELLADLRRLADAPDGRVHVLCGLGGCGKTTVALVVAQEATSRGPVWWITARDETSLATDLVDLAVEVGVPLEEIRQAGAGVRSLIDLLWQRLEGLSHRWLLVVDNADQPQLLAAEGARVGDGNGVTRGSRRGLVLVTTRVAAGDVWGGRAMLHPVGPLGDRHGGQVLCDLAPHAGTTDESAAVAARLGGLPLALRAAGHYLNSTRARLDHVGTFADYVRTVDAKFSALLGDMSGSAARREVVVTTWEVSLDLLAGQGLPQARALMRLMGGFAAAPIPVGVLDGPVLFGSRLFKLGALDGLPPRRVMYAVLAWTMAWLRRSDRYNAYLHRRVVTALCDLSLIELTTSGAAPRSAACLVTHPLVNHVNAAWLAERPAVARAVDTTVAALLVNATRGRDPHDPAEYAWWPMLAPHLAHALTHTVPRLSRESVAELVNAADSTAFGLCRAGDFQTGLTLATAAVETAGSRLHPNSPSVLRARHRLGYALDELGLYEQAEAEYRTTLAGRQRVLGVEHPETLATRHNLAVNMYQRGRYEQAEREFRALRSIRERVEGVEDFNTLRTRHMLAEVLKRRGALEAAEAEFRSVLAALERVLGHDHPDTLRTRNALAEVLAERGLHEKAETEFRAALIGRRRVLGGEHPFTLRTWQGLTDVLAQRGVRERVEIDAEYLEVLAVMQRVLGDDHPETLRARHGRAAVLARQGLREQADSEYRAVLAARERVLGIDHPDVVATRAAIEQLHRTAPTSPT